MILAFTLLSITGAVCVSRGKMMLANCIWFITNPGLIWYNLTIFEYELAFLFVVYWLISLYGICYLSCKQSNLPQLEGELPEKIL